MRVGNWLFDSICYGHSFCLIMGKRSEQCEPMWIRVKQSTCTVVDWNNYPQEMYNPSKFILDATNEYWPSEIRMEIKTWVMKFLYIILGKQMLHFHVLLISCQQMLKLYRRARVMKKDICFVLAVFHLSLIFC